MPEIRYLLPILALPTALVATACTDSTEQRLRELEDRNEIHALVDNLAAALEEGRFDAFATIYTPDVTAKSPGGEATGLDKVIALAGRNHSDQQRSPHYISNVRIELAGDRAQVRANSLFAFVPSAPTPGRVAPEPFYAGGGTYRFDAVRTPDGWRFARVETAPLWTVGTLAP
ncbi:nuclear transport factor 2 family protein [Nocardia sp. NPDC050413]|uniref:nuclear transport factor 2 family protein n=1 Tax=Nocardia sp. NPDC050413 TaxID=3155784 RepID=UPI0033E390CF